MKIAFLLKRNNTMLEEEDLKQLISHTAIAIIQTVKHTYTKNHEKIPQNKHFDFLLSILILFNHEILGVLLESNQLKDKNENLLDLILRNIKEVVMKGIDK